MIKIGWRNGISALPERETRTKWEYARHWRESISPPPPPTAKRNAILLELLLSPEEIAEGKRRAQDWLGQRKKASSNIR